MQNLTNYIRFFTWLEQIILKYVWRHKRPWIAKAILRNKELEELGYLTYDYTTKLQSPVILIYTNIWVSQSQTDFWIPKDTGSLSGLSQT